MTDATTTTTSTAGAAPATALAPLMAPLSEIAALTAATAALGPLTAGAAGWPAEDRRAVLAGLDRVVDALTAVRAAVLVAERDCGTWQGGGDRSFATWRARTAGSGQRSAAAQVRQAEHLDAVPAVVAAVTAGRVGLEQATILARMTATGTPAQRAALEDPATREQLLELAEQQDADAFAGTTARFAASVDPAGLERDHQAQRRERFLHLTDTAHGTYLKGRLDTITGHRVRLALEALTPRPAVDDDRDPGQRCADALAEMARRTLSAGDTKPNAHVPPQITMILTAETWNAARAERDHRRAHAGAGSGSAAGDAAATTGASWTAAEAVVCGTDASRTDVRRTDANGTDANEASRHGSEPVVGCPPATLEDSTPVPASELATAMCDCAITRVVIDSDGVPIDLGRTRRLFTGEQRRAIIARDRECAWPTCHMPARWCEIHHLRWWERDTGPTSVDNGALFCAFHHHEVHRRDLTVTRVLVPPGDGLLAGCGAPPPGPGRRRARRGPARTIALATYEFRDPTGHLVNEPEGTAAQPAAAVDEHHREGPPLMRPEMPAQPSSPAVAAPRLSNRARAAQPERMPTQPSPLADTAGQGRGIRTQTDEPEFTWTTDPVTGVRVPSFFLGL